MKHFILLISLVFFNNLLSAQIDSLKTSDFTNKLQIEKNLGDISQKQKLIGVITNFKTGENIPNALVELYERDELLDTIRTGIDARFSFDVARNKRYNIKAFAENFAKNSTIVFSLHNQQDKVWDVKLYPIREFIYISPNKFVDIDNIHFMMDQIAFESEDYKQLDKLVSILEKYSNIRISVNVHTDSNGVEEYDQKMTQDRADLIISYLIDNNIDPDRLESIGYGSTMLLNGCEKNVKCTEAEHRKNRRTEFLVL